MLGTSIKPDFPIFTAHRELVFLDNAASAQKPGVVLDAMDKFYRTAYANIHRGVYQLAEAATAAYEQARKQVVGFINAAAPAEVIFTHGTTSGLNGIAVMLGATLKAGDEILLTEMEHHANLIPWQQVAKHTGAILKFIPVADDGTLELTALDKLLSKKTKIVAFTAMSNVLGTLTPVAKLAAAAKRVGAISVVDAAQYAPHDEIDVQAWGADFAVFSGHKLFGPTGIGVLYGRQDQLECLEPFEFGGSMIEDVSFATATWAQSPEKFEAGTPPIAEAVGLAAALAYVTKLGWNQIKSHEHELTVLTLDKLAKVHGLHLVGPTQADKRGAVFAFTIDGVHPHDLASMLDETGIAVRSGHHCAMPLHKKLGLPATTRASFSIYNTNEDVDALIAGIQHAQQLLL